MSNSEINTVHDVKRLEDIHNSVCSYYNKPLEGVGGRLSPYYSLLFIAGASGFFLYMGIKYLMFGEVLYGDLVTEFNVPPDFLATVFIVSGGYIFCYILRMFFRRIRYGVKTVQFMDDKIYFPLLNTKIHPNTIQSITLRPLLLNHEYASFVIIKYHTRKNKDVKKLKLYPEELGGVSPSSFIDQVKTSYLVSFSTHIDDRFKRRLKYEFEKILIIPVLLLAVLVMYLLDLIFSG